jgi:hypothetical protein
LGASSPRLPLLDQTLGFGFTASDQLAAEAVLAEVPCRRIGFEITSHDPGVAVTETKDDPAADCAEDIMAHRVGQLGEVLMSHDDSYLHSSSLRQHVAQTERQPQEVLELIEAKEDWMPTMCWHSGSGPAPSATAKPTTAAEQRSVRALAAQ